MREVEIFPLWWKIFHFQKISTKKKLFENHMNWNILQRWKFFHFCGKVFQQSGKISTSLAQILQTPRSRCRKPIFGKVETFPPLQNVPMHVILEYIYFFNFLEVENFPPKWKKFHFFHMGWNLANVRV